MKRILTAAIILPFLIASILISWLLPLFVALLGAAFALAIYEFWKLALPRGVKKDDLAALYLGGGALFTVFSFHEPGRDLDVLMIHQLLIALTIGVLAAKTLKGAPFTNMITSAGVTLLGVVYIVLLGGYLVALRTGFKQQLSAHLLSFFFLVVMGSDTGAFYAGRAFGKYKLAPKISPGKTWEGVVGGVGAGLLMAALSHYWFFRDLPLKWALPLAAVMTVLGIMGDLTESALKRSAGAKDAASILPGHGGILDRLDSLLFNAPLLYYFASNYFQ